VSFLRWAQLEKYSIKNRILRETKPGFIPRCFATRNPRPGSGIRRRERVLGNPKEPFTPIRSPCRSVSSGNKGQSAHPNAASRRERATTRRGIRCFWSTSCLTERRDVCNVCLRHRGQRAEQLGGRRRIINHGLGSLTRSIPRHIGRGLLSKREKTARETFAEANCRGAGARRSSFRARILSSDRIGARELELDWR